MHNPRVYADETLHCLDRLNAGYSLACLKLGDRFAGNPQHVIPHPLTVSLASDTNRIKALDLGSDDWTWLYELAFWLGLSEKAEDHSDHVPEAQATLLSLLDDRLAEIAELHRETGSYDVVDDDRARSIVLDPLSWRTADDLVQKGSPVLFAYFATDEGRNLYFGNNGAV